MGGLLGAKDVLFVIITLFIFLWSIIDYKKAIIWFLALNIVVSLIGLSHIMYFERILFPVFISIGILSDYKNLQKISGIYLILFLYVLFISYANDQTMFDENSAGTYFFLLIFVYAGYLFNKPGYFLLIVMMLWFVDLAGVFYYYLHSVDVFSISEVDPSVRGINIDNELRGDEFYVDPNYFGSVQAIGAVIALTLLFNRNEILESVAEEIPLRIFNILRSKLTYILILFILVFEVWATIRGLSRGALFVLLGGFSMVLLLKRKYKFLISGLIILVAGYLILDWIGIAELYLYRFVNDETGTSGRTVIWKAMYESVMNHGGIVQFFFGGGNDNPWWVNWHGNYWGDTRASSHNQFLTIWANFGLVGLTLFMIPLITGVINAIKNRNVFNDLRLILFVSVCIFSFNLEPLLFAYNTWFFFVFITTFTPNEDSDAVLSNN